ncbi:EamA family transporter [Actinoplanes sp. NPDC023714]|uniref:EamA family transporter n=1 Tax=Actinoplanes sp. NPDC023714 TaxID=3154322 RepID=UPI0033F85130
MVGAAAALAGMTLAGWPVPPASAGRAGSPGRPDDPFREGRSPGSVNRRAVSCAAGAAIGFGAYFVLLHEAAPADPYGAAACARIAGGISALLLLGAWLARAGRRVPRGGWPAAAVVVVLPGAAGLLDTVADGAFAGAAASGTVGTAAVLAGMYPAVTVLLTTAVLRERLPRVHLVGVLSALLAVACLAA